MKRNPSQFKPKYSKAYVENYDSIFRKDKKPDCFGSIPGHQDQAFNNCFRCAYYVDCFAKYKEATK